MATATRTIRAPRGTSLTCKGWPQEAALRMLMNNLDPDVAERPDDLVVYGGSGKAARSWPAFDAIVRSLTALEHDETLLVQSGKPVGVFQTHPGAPRVLIANALLVPSDQGRGSPSPAHTTASTAAPLARSVPPACRLPVTRTGPARPV